jgi:hypothetical protein
MRLYHTFSAVSSRSFISHPQQHQQLDNYSSAKVLSLYYCSFDSSQVKISHPQQQQQQLQSSSAAKPLFINYRRKKLSGAKFATR